jgi:hypothetical protein
LWCKWEPDDTGEYIGWEGGEKFYDYVEWLQYLIDHFLKPWGIAIAGVVRYQGERKDDFGVVLCEDGIVKRMQGVKERPTHPKVMARESSMIYQHGFLLDSVAKINQVRNRHG